MDTILSINVKDAFKPNAVCVLRGSCKHGLKKNVTAYV
jgi:hypothetical protein